MNRRRPARPLRAMLADLNPGALRRRLSDADGGISAADRAAKRPDRAAQQPSSPDRRSSRLPAVKRSISSTSPSSPASSASALHELASWKNVLLGPPGVAHLAIASRSRRPRRPARLLGTLVIGPSAKRRQSDPAAARAHPSPCWWSTRSATCRSTRTAVLFFQLINARQRRRRCATSNKGFEDWGGVLGDHGGGSHRPPCAPLPYRQHPRQQLPDEGSSNLLQSGSDRRRKRAAE